MSKSFFTTAKRQGVKSWRDSNGTRNPVVGTEELQQQPFAALAKGSYKSAEERALDQKKLAYGAKVRQRGKR